MKKIALSLLVALSCISAKAADGKSLFVSFNDGKQDRVCIEHATGSNLWE